MTRVLVTGGAGFVGATLVRELVRDGVGVRVLDDLSAGRPQYLRGVDVEFREGTVGDALVVRRAARGCLAIVHLAAKSGVTRATMTGLLDSLERKRLIRRESDQADRRTVMVRLNDKGIELLEGMLHDYYHRISLLMGDLSEDEKRNLTEMLLKVAGGIRHV